MAGFWESILPGGLGAYGYAKTIEGIENQQDKVAGTIAGLTDDVQANTQFTPWGVSSNIGTTSADTGGISYGLDPTQQGLQDQLFTGASGMFSSATMDPAQREAEIYERTRAMMLPEEERQRQQMQQRMFSQGRMGLSSFEGGGGSPEELAYNTAVEEAKLKAAFGSMGQARQEQLQDYNIGQGMFSSGYKPNQELMKLMTPGLDNAKLGQINQLERAGLMAQLGLGGLTADTNYENIKGNAFGNMITAAMPVLAGAGAGVDNAGGLFQLIDEWF
jgi:hypothetical protein